jgi:hypothetical protein
LRKNKFMIGIVLLMLLGLCQQPGFAAAHSSLTLGAGPLDRGHLEFEQALTPGKTLALHAGGVGTEADWEVYGFEVRNYMFSQAFSGPYSGLGYSRVNYHDDFNGVEEADWLDGKAQDFITLSFGYKKATACGITFEVAITGVYAPYGETNLEPSGRLSIGYSW